MKKVLIAALIAGFSLSATAAETIRFATEASYPPFESIDANNQIVGFDVDLAQALCKEIDATCTFSNQAFDSLIPSLKFRRVEAVMAGMDITPEREKQVLFTTPYYDNSALFVGQQGKYTSVDQLKGKKVGVQNGTTHQKFIMDKHPEIYQVDENGVVRWNFFPEQCRHCLVPPCKDVADMTVEGAIIQDEKTGAVIMTEKTKQLSPDDCEAVRQACPYNVPRRDDKTGMLTKCDMCIDRLQAGMVPICVKTCPTGTMVFGEREEILKIAKERLAVVKKTFPKAFLANPEDVSVIYLLADDKDKYFEFAAV